MKDLIGKKVRGFEFDHFIDDTGWDNDMYRYIGTIGTIMKQSIHTCGVRFPDNNYFLYPNSLIEQHLVEEPNTNEPSFKDITDSLSSLLEHKNKNYGNSALEPLEVFGNKCKVGTRLDDKLARVKNSEELRRNDVVDLLGYLVLTCKEKGWTNFDDLKD